MTACKIVLFAKEQSGSEEIVEKETLPSLRAKVSEAKQPPCAKREIASQSLAMTIMLKRKLSTNPTYNTVALVIVPALILNVSEVVARHKEGDMLIHDVFK